MKEEEDCYERVLDPEETEADDKEWEQSVIFSCLLKINMYYFDMDVIGINSDRGPLTYIDQICIWWDSASDGARSIAEGDYDLGEGVLFDWMDAFGCLETVAEMDTLVKNNFEELSEIRSRVQKEWQLAAHNDNVPKWGRGTQ